MVTMAISAAIIQPGFSPGSMATKIEPKKTTTFGLEIWVMKSEHQRIARILIVCPFIHLDGVGCVPEDLKGDPQEKQGTRHLHADEQPVKLAEQEVEAEKSCRRPHDGPGPESQRKLDAVGARSRDGGARRDEKLGPGLMAASK